MDRREHTKSMDEQEWVKIVSEATAGLSHFTILITLNIDPFCAISVAFVAKLVVLYSLWRISVAVSGYRRRYHDGGFKGNTK